MVSSTRKRSRLVLSPPPIRRSRRLRPSRRRLSARRASDPLAARCTSRTARGRADHAARRGAPDPIRTELLSWALRAVDGRSGADGGSCPETRLLVRCARPRRSQESLRLLAWQLTLHDFWRALGPFIEPGVFFWA